MGPSDGRAPAPSGRGPVDAGPPPSTPPRRRVRAVPELPEVERARALIADRALGRLIVEVDDSDTWVCRPHAPGEIAAALEGRRLVSANRIGKTMWCETDE